MSYDDWKLATPDEYERSAPRSDDLGDETEICGCEEAVALRARVEQAEALSKHDQEALVSCHETRRKALDENRALRAKLERVEGYLRRDGTRPALQLLEALRD